jgi:hypothetical protein
VVDQLLTEMRSTGLPRQREPVIQAVPSAISRAVTSAVRSSLPNETQTWEKTTSFSIVAPSMAAMPLANAVAWRQKPSTRAATPSRPRARSTAQTGIARARRDTSGTVSTGSPASSWMK